MTAERRVAELIKMGHLKRADGQKRGQRARYLLTSPVFGSKDGTVDTVVYGKKTKRLATLDYERHGLPAKKAR